ncbi:MAG: hypothetical protein ACJA08_000728 [Cyclobacteriaceae bacterium]|jgi:hypothetical protein
MFFKMQRDFIGYFTLILALTSCLSTDLDSMDVQSDYDIIYLNSLSQKEDFSNDPYKIIAITPRGNDWSVVVEYSGGCGEHLFYLWWDGVVKYSEPPQFDLYLIHNGNDDACEAIIRDTINFDLVNALDGLTFDDRYITSIHNETRSQSIEVDSHIAQFTTDACNLKSNITEQNCSFSALGNIWIQPEIDTQNYTNILLQPVRIGKDSTILEVRPGEVNVDVTVLFGFVYDTPVNVNQDCNSWPEGVVVPVLVNCIDPL